MDFIQYNFFCRTLTFEIMFFEESGDICFALIKFKLEIMSDTKEYGLFVRSIVIRLIRFESFNCFLTFCLFLMDEAEFLRILKWRLFCFYGGDRTEDEFVRCRNLLKELLGNGVFIWIL